MNRTTENLELDLVGHPVSSSTLFKNVSQSDTQEILAKFHRQTFRPGARVVTEDLQGSDFFVIVSGTASLRKSGVKIGRLGSGDFFGEIGVLSDGLRLASVIADSTLECLVLPNGELESVMGEHPIVGVNLIREVIGRYRHLVSPIQFTAVPSV